MLTQASEGQISERDISELVDRFYDRVREDAEIGPIFNEKIQGWPAHLELLKNFWSTVLHTSTRYRGNPMMTHLQLPLSPPTSAAGWTCFARLPRRRFRLRTLK